MLHHTMTNRTVTTIVYTREKKQDFSINSAEKTGYIHNETRSFSLILYKNQLQVNPRLLELKLWNKKKWRKYFKIEA